MRCSCFSFQGKCVKFYCAPDRIIQDGKCVHVVEEVSDLSYLLLFSLQLVDNDTIERREIEFRPYFLCMTILKNIRDRFHIVGIEHPLFSDCTVNTKFCESQSLNVSSNDEYTSDKLWIIPNNTTVNIQMIVFETQTNKLTLFEDILIDTFEEEFMVNGSKFCNYTNYESVEWASGCTQGYEFMSSEARQQAVKLKRVHRCLMVDRLVKDDLVLDDKNNILLIHNSDIKVSHTDFEVYKNDGQIHARICYKALPLEIGTNLYQNSPTQFPKSVMEQTYNIFSSTCTGLSMLGLLITFITYCLFKDLRTVPGKNNMHLSFCLLVGQAGLQYSLSLSGLYDSLQCKITGILIHYFWLATFCAMNVCSYHMYQVFFARSMHVNPTPQQKLRRALKYALFIYFVPFFTVFAVVLGNVLQSGFQNVGYGVSICFIDQFYVLIASFIAPTGMITTVNIVFYCLTFYRLRVAPTLRSTNQNRQDLVIYAKLCSITGIMWPLVFADALLELSVFSFLATFANAFQGVFMFLSFVCNRRVFGMYKALAGKEPDSPVLSFPNSTRSTDKSVKSQSERPVSNLSYSDIQDGVLSSPACSDIQDRTDPQ